MSGDPDFTRDDESGNPENADDGGQALDSSESEYDEEERIEEHESSDETRVDEVETEEEDDEDAMEADDSVEDVDSMEDEEVDDEWLEDQDQDDEWREDEQVAGPGEWMFQDPDGADADPDNLPKTLKDRELAVRPETTEMGPADIRETILGEVKDFFHKLAEEQAVDPTVSRRWRHLAEKGASREEVIPSDGFIEEQWFDFDYLEEYEQVDRYWVNKPFAYITILYDDDRKSFRYHVTEPILDDFERYVRDDLIRIVRNGLMYEDVDATVNKEDIFRRKTRELILEHAATVNVGTVHKLTYFLFRDFLDYGRIDPIMRDWTIEDISCDGVDIPVFVYHREYRDLRTNITFDQNRLNSLTVRLAQRAGKHISISNPLVDASLPDGSRIQLTLGQDISTRGSNFTIRKFSDIPYTPIDLINWNTFSVEEMAYFWLAIENNRSLIFAGGTGSGKTTSMNAVSFFIPPDSKVVTIEDTREITLPHDNWIQSLTRASASGEGRGEVSTYDLLQAALRQRPEYILVGEMRTESRVALTFFQAIATGHTAYSTVHADTVEAVMGRLQNPPLSVPAQMIQHLDIVSIQQQVYKGDRRVRRNQEIAEINPRPSLDEVATTTIFQRDAEIDEYDQVSHSNVLDEIAEQRGWTPEELEHQLETRERVLHYMVDHGINAYEDVATTIETFARNPEYILDLIESEELVPADLPAEAI